MVGKPLLALNRELLACAGAVELGAESPELKLNSEPRKSQESCLEQSH